MIHITGATGHLGNNLVRLLLDKGISFQLCQRQSGPALAGLPVKAALGDIFDRDFLSQQIHSGDTLIHIAALIDLKNNQPDESDRINHLGMKTIVDFCLDQHVRLIYISSVDCIHREKTQVLIREPETIDPTSLQSNYAISKAKGTQYLLEKMENKRIDAVILYPSAVIGVNDFKPSAAGNEIRRALRRRIFFYIKGGYNFIDVRDCARAILSCIEEPISGSYILAGYNRTLVEFYREIAKSQGHRALYIPIPAMIARAFVHLIPNFSRMMIDAVLDNYHYDNLRMRQDLISELTPFSQTVKDTIEWFQTSKVQS